MPELGYEELGINSTQKCSPEWSREFCKSFCICQQSKLDAYCRVQCGYKC